MPGALSDEDSVFRSSQTLKGIKAWLQSFSRYGWNSSELNPL